MHLSLVYISDSFRRDGESIRGRTVCFPGQEEVIYGCAKRGHEREEDAEDVGPNSQKKNKTSLKAYRPSIFGKEEK